MDAAATFPGCRGRLPGIVEFMKTVDTDYARTYYVSMTKRTNLTLSADAELLRRSRAVAQAMGKSLNQLIREYLERISRTDDAPEELSREFRLLSLGSRGGSGGEPIDRDELHERS